MWDFAMSFKSIHGFIICSLLLILTACSDTDKEKELVDGEKLRAEFEIVMENFKKN